MSGGNYIAYNLGLNPAVNFNFMLRVEGVFDLPCKSVRSFQKENEYEYIQEGGLNDYVHMRRKPVSKPFTIQVERYVGVDMLDPLANGTELVLPMILYVNRYSVYGEFHPVRMYVFSGCTVMSKEYGELNAEQSGLLLETTTIAYREMYTVENIATSFVTEDTWKFDELNKQGNGNRKAVSGTKFNVREEEKSQLATKAVKYSFKDKIPTGVRVSKFTGDITAAKKWMFKGGNTHRAKEEAANNGVRGTDYTLSEGNTIPDFLGIGTISSKSAQISGTSEIRKKQMVTKSKRYHLKEDKNGSAKINETELSKEEMTGKSVRYNYKSDNNNNKSAIVNKTELRKQAMDAKSKKYDIAMNTGKSSTGSDDSREKQAWERKAKKWPKASSAMTVEKFMSNAKIGKK